MGKKNNNSHKAKKKEKTPPPEEEFLEESEEEEPEEDFDCCDKCLFASFGFICLYLGMLVIFFTERDHKYSQRDITYITANIKEIDTLTQSADEISKLVADIVEHQYPVHFIDKISNDKQDMIVMDDRTDLSYPGVALKVYTEMYQWIEREEIVTSRSEGNTETKSVYSYYRNWSSIYHDSSHFNNKEDYYNPQPTVSQLKTRTIWVDDIVIGQKQSSQFHLAKSLYNRLSVRSRWKNVTSQAAKYSDMEGWEMRNGFLFRPYDKVESYFAAEEPKKDDQSATEGEGEGEDDDDGPPERTKLTEPRTLVGDIRMTVIALDAGGETISYLGSMKSVGDAYSDHKQTVLVPWKSPTKHKFAMLKYGKVGSADAMKEFKDENTLKLWLSRGFTLVAMCVGFFILPGVLNTTVKQLRLPLGPLPFETWTKLGIGAVVMAVILWTVTVVIAYLVGMIQVALGLLGVIIVMLFLNNKTVLSEEELELQMQETLQKKDQ